MSTQVLATKLFPPTPRPESVVRSRLATTLDRTLERGHRLTLISAPAGFGKTTLLTDWTARLSERRTRLGWLSLDEGDNALPRFLTHVWATLTAVGLDLPPEALDSLAEAPITATLTALVNEAVRAGQEHPDSHWLLVLEDYHLIRAPDVHEAVTFLLEHLPEQLHLVVTTRSDPPLPLSRLRGRGQLTEIRAAELRFSSAEAREFLNDAMELHLNDSDVDALEERTEGWIAGLQLAALSLRNLPNRAETLDFIAAFTGSHRFVIDYLVDEVLTRQDPEVGGFLLRTAILESFTGSLCDAVTGREDGSRMLAELDRSNVFLVPLDAERSWYRYHHLFGDVLRARLIAGHPEEVPALHRAASDWYAAHDRLTDAVRHSLAAGDHDRAGYLMESGVAELSRTRQDAVLLNWMRSLPAEVVRRSPVLSITAAWSRMMTGDLAGMEGWLDDAEAALAAGAQDAALAATWADTADLRFAPALVWVYRAALAQARGDVAATVRSARRALDLSGPEDHFVRGAAAGFLGLAAWAAGNVQEALATFSDAVRSLHAAGKVVDELDSTVVLGAMWVSAGRPRAARHVFERALATATAHGPPYPRATADLHVGLAELDRERNDLNSAEAHLETARVLRERASITENRHGWHIARARLSAAQGNHTLVAALLDQAEAVYRPGSYPDLTPIPAIRARLNLAAGDLDAAEAWAREHGVSLSAPATFLQEYAQLTLVRVLLGRHRRDEGDPAALGEVLALLDRLQADAEPERGGSLLEIGMLRALVHDARGDRAAALTELAHAWARAPEPDCSVRLILDEGAPMLTLVRDAGLRDAGLRDAVLRDAVLRDAGVRDAVLRDAGVRDAVPRDAGVRDAVLRDSGVRDAVLREAGAAYGGGGAGGARLIDPLSDRELEVLRLLASELTGPEIARRLFVSLNTLRTHTKRIFHKLAVNNRAAAVRRGREAGLL